MHSMVLLNTVDSNKQRFAALCYRLQGERLTCARVLEEFQAACRRHGLPARDVDFEPFPVYTFARIDGVLRMVSRPRIEGGEGFASRAFVRFSTDTAPEAVALHVEGELDLSTAQSLANAIEGAYRKQRCVIVDLSRLAYLDGSGIRVLMRFAEENRGRFVVIGSTPTIRRLFEILRLVDILPVVHSVDDARQYLHLQGNAAR